MPRDIAIRLANHDDLPAVLRLWQEAEVTPPGPTDSLEGLTRLIQDPGGVLLVATLDGRIVGSVIGGWDGWRGSIYRLAVTPAWRHQGIARELVAAISRALFAKGAERISALVEHEHAWATGFWDSLDGLGYQRDPKFIRYIADRKRTIR
ncbi:MAG: GNAT family N-acetyltransferase [Deltaproteobacteria bacterium]|nr:GNAT family N-acetyltransferase [Deltaproteobacteria bacterium]